MRISLTVNGSIRSLEVEPDQRLSSLLRDDLRLTSVKEGCREGECGACTVLLDGKPINACLMLAFQADGRAVVTVEGHSGATGGLSPLQLAFLTRGAVQCGYCTPGMILAAEGLLLANPSPTEAEVRHALAGNLCRCTGFQTIVDAVLSLSAAAS